MVLLESLIFLNLMHIYFNHFNIN